MKKSLHLLFIALLLCGQTNAQYHFYFGNIHSHTAYSDGTKDDVNGTPASSYEYAKGTYHMDFLGVAEHNHFSSANNPGMHVADYAKGLYQADTSNKNGTFVCLFGMEYGVIDNGGHVIIYGIPGLIGWEYGNGGWGSGNNYNIYNSKYNYQTLWAIVNQYPNAFATLAHPQNNDYANLLEGTFNASADSAIVGCAIRSGDAFSTTNNYSDGPATLYQGKYFLGLSKGFHIGPTIDHDNHYTTFGRTNHSRTVVIARALNRDSILAAYKARHFYASDDWDAEVTLLVNNHIMGDIDSSTSDPQIQISIADPANNNGGTDATQKIELYYGVPRSGALPTILTSNTGSNNLTYTHSVNLNGSFYYFAKITQTDGNIIWTSPVWMKKVAQTTNPSAVNAPSFQHTNALVVYPNPASDAILFDLEIAQPETALINVYDANGRSVVNTTRELVNGINHLSIDIHSLMHGMYFLVVTGNDRRISQARFIKE